MAEQLVGLPYWQFEFGEHGERVSVPAAAALGAELSAARITDLFVFTHGWNNSPAAARDLYTRFYTQLAAFTGLSGSPSRLKPNVVVGISGTIWPSMQWIDEGAPGGGAPVQAAAITSAVQPVTSPAAPDDAQVVAALAPLFPGPSQQAALTELGQLLQTRPNSDAALARFQTLMGILVPAPPAGAPLEDQGQRALVQKDYHEVFDRMATAAQLAGAGSNAAGGGAAAVGGPLGWLWNGAKEALRQLTYWRMKDRAGVVGEQGLGPFIGELHRVTPALRVHLIGHSFGSRLISFTLKGLPQPAAEGRSPVKSLTMLQGAFSHFSFAASLPQDRTRSGALSGMQARVDGPILASFSQHDSAVGIFYPWASMATGQDASDVSDPLYAWGAMGHDGSQAVNATPLKYLQPGTNYGFGASGFYNLDGNDVIVSGGPPSGAHGDICHPQIAWATLAAAGIAAV